MKKSKLFFAFLIAGLTVFNLVSCGKEDNPSSNNSTSEQPEQQEQLSAYDQLTEVEKKIYDAFILNIYDFYNPSEVRFLKASRPYEDMGQVDLLIKGSNKIGNTLTKWYTLCYKTTTYTSESGNTYTNKFGDLKELPFDGFENDIVSTFRLNKALEEYWK